MILVADVMTTLRLSKRSSAPEFIDGTAGVLRADFANYILIITSSFDIKRKL